MKEELQRGPISCGIYVSDKFENYSGGIFQENTHFWDMINHELSIVGYGVDKATGQS